MAEESKRLSRCETRAGGVLAGKRSNAGLSLLRQSGKMLPMERNGIEALSNEMIRTAVGGSACDRERILEAQVRQVPGMVIVL